MRRAAELVAETLVTHAASSSATQVTAALTRVTGEAADQLARLLTTLAEDSRRVLAKTARVLDLPEHATGDEWTALMRELPQVDPGSMTIDLNLTMLGALGRRVADARVYRTIEAQAGRQLRSAIETHSRLLRSWGLRVLARLRQQFDAQAQVYRAQLAGSSAGQTSDIAAEQALRELAAFAGPDSLSVDAHECLTRL